MPNTIGPTQRLLRLAYPLVVFLVIAANVQAQDKPVLAPAKPAMQTTETLTLTPQQFLELREIESLRARRGGISERLRGITDADPEQQFHNSLIEKLASKKAATVTLGPAVPTRPLKRNKGPATASAQAVLRASAKKLEDLAAELEQVPFYDEADELRGMAAKYWLQARSMD